MGSSKMSSLILNFGGKAMGEPLSMLRSQQLGPRTVTTFSFKVVAKTLACIAFTRVAASSQESESATSRAAALHSVDVSSWHLKIFAAVHKIRQVLEVVPT
jgi:hypothetical protein